MLEVGDLRILCHLGVLVRTCTGLEILLRGICRQRWEKKGKGPHAFVLGLRVKKGKDEEMANSESKAVDIAKVPLQKPCGRKVPVQAVPHDL